MNITDIDDKIIKRARQNYLFSQYTKQPHAVDEILADIRNIHDKLTETVKNTEDADKREMLIKLLNKVGPVFEFLKNNQKDFEMIDVSLRTFKKFSCSFFLTDFIFRRYWTVFEILCQNI